jgi:paraquat-inducible protein B
MSKPANKTLIGAFVVGAVVLFVAAIVLFGSGRFFRQTETYFTYFDGSLKGLNVGSAVVFRGVQVGQVTDIIVGFEAAKLDILIPVIFELDLERFKDIGPARVKSDQEMYEALVARGLRAQLQMQSLVTGQLVINLDFLPNTPARLRGIDKFAGKIAFKSMMEIPSIPTPLQRLEKSIENISFEEVVDDVRRAMDGIAKLATSPELHASIGEFKETLNAVKKLAHDVDSKVEPLATRLDQTLVDVRAGIGDARKLMATDIKDALKSATTAMDNANKSLASIKGTQLRHEISDTLREIAAASRSVRVLADFIEQHPDAVLRGRATGTGGN